jgi:hypothetical protein
MNTPKTHPVNVSYLVVGLVFLGIAASWALRASGVIDTGDVSWLGPLVLVGAGVIGLVAFAVKNLGRDRHPQPDEYAAAVEPPTYDPFTAAETERRAAPDDTTPVTDDTTRFDTDTRGDQR